MTEDDAQPFKGYDKMVQVVGKRHATCWFDNYETPNDEDVAFRKHALSEAIRYAKALKTEQRSGRNIIFAGSCGTGKDHLAVSVLRAALSYNMGAKYIRGSVLCSECRKHSLEHSQDVPYAMWNVDLLVISDIEPHAEKPATEFERRALLELIDRRYTAMLPTVVTTNKNTKPELVESIGERVVDRLYEGAVIVPMIWPSYRG